MEEKVSIIIPVYQVAAWLEKCVTTLCEGTYQNIEVLLIDDGSTDDSLSVCYNLQKKYDSIRVFANEKNLGVSATRNRGLQEMTGKYLLFVDGDDWVESEYVERMIKAHNKFKSTLTLCGYVNHDEMQSGTTDYFGFADVDGEEVRPLRANLQSLLDGRLLQLMTNKLYMVEIIKKYGLTFDPNMKIGEDFRFLLSYLRVVEGDSLTVVNGYLYHYNRCVPSSAMFRVGLEGVEEPLKNLRSLYEIIGYEKAEIEEKLIKDRMRMIANYAYMIVHNQGMSWKKKKKLIYSLDSNNASFLYRRNKRLYYKERIALFLKKIRGRKSP